jgi:small-conductance mechanosensitive channel
VQRWRSHLPGAEAPEATVIDRVRELWDGHLWPLQLLVLGGLALGAHALVFLVIRLAARRTGRQVYDRLATRCAAPSRLLLPVLAVHLGARGVLASNPTLQVALGCLLIGTLAWTSMRLTVVMEDLLLARSLGDQPGVAARKLRTQVSVLRRVISFVIAVVAIAAIFMNIERLRQLGTGLLASAGIAGLVIGFSAQKTLGNLLAGIQIALAQPIRVGDAVVVEGEWGHVEDITLTYVVLRVWDLRRLILPISYFIEKPFQNWTVTSEEVIGTVNLHVDYKIPVDSVRAELIRLVEVSPLWDHKTLSLQVVDTTDRTVVLRALVSAVDSGKCWELRCQVRERLLEFLRTRHPDCLPRIRAELDSPGTPRTSVRNAPTEHQPRLAERSSAAPLP